MLTPWGKAGSALRVAICTEAQGNASANAPATCQRRHASAPGGAQLHWCTRTMEECMPARIIISVTDWSMA